MFPAHLSYKGTAFQAGSLSTGALAMGHMVPGRLASSRLNTWGWVNSVVALLGSPPNSKTLLYICTFVSFPWQGLKVFCACENLWVDGMADIMVTGKTWGLGPKPPTITRAPCMNLPAQGVSVYLAEPCPTHCTDDLGPCNMSHENSGLQQQ